ncbi:Dabb family protein [Yinghuangia soli]|uniref:Dabb family protein n=1 Tax=Yinghuangia soli TaxID=2908204 RepID=A0AA41Q4R8_9ACTN|nr:Dabb family protein [Yinghuangia soli]MCF2531550.1 Dabb family protein [Yinghuangia soli]
MISHVVLMRFIEPADALPARDLLQGMHGRVAEIASLTVDVDLAVAEQGPDLPLPQFHLCLITTHTSREELRGYQDHPVHLEAAAWLRPRLAGRAVVDSAV